MLSLGARWAPVLTSQPETGMGFQLATVTLLDGRKFEQVIIVGGTVTSVNGVSDIPFEEHDIAEIIAGAHRGNGVL